MKLKSLAPNHILVKINEAKAGALITSSKETAVEKGEVLGAADDVKWPKKGDVIYFKAWGTDIITDGEERYYFIDLATRSVKAVIK